MHRLFSIFFLVGALPGQQGVAPTAARVGPLRGEDVSGYNVVNSFETGYRFRSVGGDLGKYRSDVNYGNGVRLVASKLTVNSKDGHGRMFDEIVLTTQGLGNDPYQFSSLRIQKNRLYRYDMFWRSNDYVNPGLTIAGGQHLSDTQRRFQDHDLTLLPQSKIRLFLGYTRNSQDGPALTTIQLFDSRGDEFPLFSDIRRVRNEYRLGGEIQLAGVKLNWLRGWDDFKEDTPTLLPAASEGNNPNDRTTLASLRRDEPYHGTTPYWRLNLFTEKTSWARHCAEQADPDFRQRPQAGGFGKSDAECFSHQQAHLLQPDRLSQHPNRRGFLFPRVQQHGCRTSITFLPFSRYPYDYQHYRCHVPGGQVVGSLWRVSSL
jgi:hypothetical protein